MCAVINVDIYLHVEETVLPFVECLFRRIQASSIRMSSLRLIVALKKHIFMRIVYVSILIAIQSNAKTTKNGHSSDTASSTNQIDTTCMEMQSWRMSDE